MISPHNRPPRQPTPRDPKVNIPRTIDVRSLRQRLNMSPTEFSMRYGFSLGSLQNWEQRHRKPEGPARVLLTLIDRIPEAIEKALKAA